MTRISSLKLIQKSITLSRMVFLFAMSFSVNALNININPGSALASNTDALAAFNRAALFWSGKFTDSITVNIDANLINLGSATILGQASSVRLIGGYSTIVNMMRADSLSEVDDGVVGFLPNTSQFSALLPTGFGLSGLISGTKANLKALGFAGLDTDFGTNDATIDFNSGFSFDFDNSDGVGSGLFDFESIAAHEIGHSLGFISSVDEIDFLANNKVGAAISPTTLDLFRFAEWDNPETTAEFTTKARDLVPGHEVIFDDLDNELAFSTGSFFGDGHQASHWKDDSLTGILLGVMDPTFGPGSTLSISDADLRALDLIGYDYVVPVPAALWLFASGLIGLIVIRKNRASFI